MKLPREEVERRLSQMILDGTLAGQLDHRSDCLSLFQQVEKGGDPVYRDAMDTIAQLEKTVSRLSEKANQLLSQ